MKYRAIRSFMMFFASLVPATIGSLAQEKAIGCSELRLNEIQVIGVHNTYHAGLAPSEARLLKSDNPKLFHLLDYRHRSISAELDAGVRQIELDVILDRKGGTFRSPKLIQKVAAARLPLDPPLDGAHELDKPGYKVMHIRDVDYRSTCEPYTGCLAEIAKWSRTHPYHVPIFVFTENKETDGLTTQDLDRLDGEVRSVFTPNELLTPDSVRRESSTLRSALTTRGWPLLNDVKGKVIFLLAKDELETRYAAGHSQLEGRVFFPNSKMGRSYSAFVTMPDPQKDAIAQAVRDKYLVLTRSDTFETDDAAKLDYTMEKAAIRSGAQLILTDYPPGEPQASTGFVVEFPNGLRAVADHILTPTCTVDLLTLERP